MKCVDQKGLSDWSGGAESVSSESGGVSEKILCATVSELERSASVAMHVSGGGQDA